MQGEYLKSFCVCIEKLRKAQEDTNDLLKALVSANESFLSTLTQFLNLDYKLKVDSEHRRMEQAKKTEPTPHDSLY